MDGLDGRTERGMMDGNCDVLPKDLLLWCSQRFDAKSMYSASPKCLVCMLGSVRVKYKDLVPVPRD